MKFRQFFVCAHVSFPTWFSGDIQKLVFRLHRIWAQVCSFVFWLVKWKGSYSKLSFILRRFFDCVVFFVFSSFNINPLLPTRFLASKSWWIKPVTWNNNCSVNMRNTNNWFRFVEYLMFLLMTSHVCSRICFRIAYSASLFMVETIVRKYKNRSVNEMLQTSDAPQRTNVHEHSIFNRVESCRVCRLCQRCTFTSIRIYLFICLVVLRSFTVNRHDELERSSGEH